MVAILFVQRLQHKHCFLAVCFLEFDPKLAFHRDSQSLQPSHLANSFGLLLNTGPLTRTSRLVTAVNH
jgi:hypothetical protein